MNIAELLENPSMMHAAMVHLPIVLAMVGFAFTIVYVFFQHNHTLRLSAILIYVALLISVEVSLQSGENARGLVPNTMPDAVWELLDTHETLAGWVRITGAAALLLLLCTWIRHDEVRRAASLLAASAGLACVVVVGLTGHHGGMLVYEHGIGTDPVKHRASEPAKSGRKGAKNAPEDNTLVPVRPIDMDEAGRIDFQKDVWPIIEDRCIDCHEDPDADGELSLDTIAAMSKAGKKAGPGVIPGDPDGSAIIQYVVGERKPRMPHKKDPLPEDEVHILRMWIAAGARDSASTGEAPAPAPEEVEEAFDPFG